jgi:hypothetical protein
VIGGRHHQPGFYGNIYQMPFLKNTVCGNQTMRSTERTTTSMNHPALVVYADAILGHQISKLNVIYSIASD